MNATKTPPLYALVDSYLSALSRIDAETGEIDAETLAVLEALSPQLSERIEACAAVVTRLEAEAEASDALAKQYHARSVARGNEADRVRRYMLEQMQRADIKRVNGACHTTWLQASTRVEIEDGAALDARFTRVVPERREPDKKAIKAALEAGEDVPRARLVTEEGVRIR